MAIGHRSSIIDSLGRLFDSGTVTGLSEAQLLDRFLTRSDETAFEEILHRHGPMILGVNGGEAQDHVRNPHDFTGQLGLPFHEVRQEILAGSEKLCMKWAPTAE